MRRLILAISTLLLLSQASAATFSDLTKPIVLTKHQRTFTVALPSNPTTGYQWALLGDYNTDLIRPIGHTYQAKNPKLIGSGGQSLWTFRLTSQALQVPTRLELHFVYGRAWEGKAGKQQIITVITQ